MYTYISRQHKLPLTHLKLGAPHPQPFAFVIIQTTDRTGAVIHQPSSISVVLIKEHHQVLDRN